MRVYFINHEHEENVHEILDSSMIFVFSKISGATEVHMSHGMIRCLAPLLHELGVENVVTYPTYLYPHKGHIRELIAAFNDIRLLFASKRNSLLYFSSINIFSIHLLNVLATFFNDRKIIFNCHSDMELLANVPTGGRFNIFPRIIRNFFFKAKISDNVYFFVLGDSILKNISGILPVKQCKKFFSCIHPYYSVNQVHMADVNTKHGNDIAIGIVGSVSKNKGFDNIKNFARTVKLSGRQVKIYFMSRVEDDSDICSIEGIVNLNPDNSFIPRTEYDKLVGKMDFIYFPYQADGYCLTASGAVFEAIINHKPIIAFHNGYFDYLFDRFGPMGILYSSYEEMVASVSALTNIEISMFKKNAERAAEAIHPANLYGEFKSVLERMKII